MSTPPRPGDEPIRPLEPMASNPVSTGRSDHRVEALASWLPDPSEAALYRQILEHVACGVVLIDSQGAIAYANDTFSRMVGASTVVGRHLREFFAPEVRSAVDFALKGTTDDSAGLDLALDASAGSKVVRLVLTPLSDGLFCGLIHDLTDRRIDAERLSQSERLAAFRQVLSVISHSTRNALQRTLACIDMALRKLDGLPDVAKLLVTAREAQTDVHRLLNQVRQYTAPIQLDLARIDLRQCWREAWNELSSLREGRQVELQEVDDGGNRLAAADLPLLRQAFQYLLENALAAVDDAVTVTVSCREGMTQGRPAIQVEIRDNGPGVDPEIVPRLFEPFFTTRPKATGLGLPIVKRIVEAHGGAIALEPGYGTGLAVTLTIPRTP